MDWILIGAIAVSGWAILSVLSGQRFGQAQQIALALAERAKAKDVEQPIDLSKRAA